VREPTPELLWPRPQHAVETADGIHLREGFRLVTEARPGEPVLSALRDELAPAGLALGEHGAGRPLAFVLEDGSRDAYRLTVGPAGATIRAASEVGLAHGTATLIQWLRLHRFAGKRRLGGLEVEDRPDYPNRGVMLDISRNRVPTMAALFRTVDFLAALKINQIQLYTEHTFAYRDHARVWDGFDPMTGDQIRELDAYCRARHIELIANQNSFGHFHRWLTHAPYRALAEVPEGVSHAFSPEPEPFSLCPTDPGSLDLLLALYDELLPNFTSNTVNVGMDETFDLGMGRSADAVAEHGKTEVYLAFLKKVHAALAERGKRMMFWGDIIIQRPELIEQLPEDAIPLEWGYEADHPFDAHDEAFRSCGLDFYVCPGTSGWQSITGRGKNALGNLASAARSGKTKGAIGYMITDWGDWGHLQPPPVAMMGILIGAGYAWNADVADALTEPDIPVLLNLWGFDDPDGVYGETVWALSNLYLYQTDMPANGTCLFYLLRFAEETMGHERLRGLRGNCLAETRAALHRIEAGFRPTKTIWRDELYWAMSLLHWLIDLGEAWLSAGDDVPLIAIDRARRQELSAALDPIIAAHESLWVRHCRPGGLHESKGRLTRMQDLLLRWG